MRPAYRALSVPLISCPRAATRLSLDLVINLYSFKVSESICVASDALKFCIIRQVEAWEESLIGLLSQQQEPGNDPTSKQRL